VIASGSCRENVQQQKMMERAVTNVVVAVVFNGLVMSDE